MKVLRFTIVMMMLWGCASSGVQVKPGQVASLQKGVTTYSEVIARFGHPTSTGVNSNGHKIISYIYSHAQARPASFIPIVGLVAGGADVRSNVVQLTFGPDDKLLEYTASESSLGMGTGLLGSGAYKAPIEQPRETIQPEPSPPITQ